MPTPTAIQDAASGFQPQKATDPRSTILVAAGMQWKDPTHKLAFGSGQGTALSLLMLGAERVVSIPLTGFVLLRE